MRFLRLFCLSLVMADGTGALGFSWHSVRLGCCAREFTDHKRTVASSPHDASWQKSDGHHATLETSPSWPSSL